ncbi:hypothetical protein A6R68_19783, partial [Neotoma lepida]
MRGQQRAGAGRLAQAQCAVVAVRGSTRVPACRAGVLLPPPSYLHTMEGLRCLPRLLPRAVQSGRALCAVRLSPAACCGRATPLLSRSSPRAAGGVHRSRTSDASQATLASVAQVFAVTKFDKEGNVTSFERKKTELYHELALQARDLRFQHYLKAVITPECLLILDYRNLNLEQWLFRELPSQLAGDGQLVTYPLPFEFRAIEALLQYWINTLQGKLSILQPLILETLDALVDPKHSSVDRGKLHVLLQNGKSEKSSAGIDHAEEMELLLENYYRLADDLSNEARELRVLIDDSQSIIFINLDSHRNVMMRLNLQLTMGTFSLSLFGLMGVAFGMNLESSLEE